MKAFHRTFAVLMSFILMFVLSACGSEPESEAENAHEISVTVSVTMHPTEPAISDKSTEIGEPENKSDTDNTDVNTPDNTDKISIELKEKANSNELLDVDIRFGNPWIESLKNLQEQYPDEYSAYLLVKNADGDVAIDDETTRLAEACMELKTKLPSSWLRKQAEVLFQKYPELRECEVADCGNDIFVVH